MDDVTMTLPTGESERDVILTTRRHVDPCTMEEEKLGHREMAFPEEGGRGERQGGGGGRRKRERGGGGRGREREREGKGEREREKERER